MMHQSTDRMLHVSYAMGHDITIVPIPPNTTAWLQPCDVLVFDPAKNKVHQTIDELKEKSVSSSLKRSRSTNTNPISAQPHLKHCIRCTVCSYCTNRCVSMLLVPTWTVVCSKLDIMDPLKFVGSKRDLMQWQPINCSQI